jgi:L-rhamnose isomerase
MNQTEKSYDLAKDKYASVGIDTEKVIEILSSISLSMHCWQGDDVVGFESAGQIVDGGIMATGSYPGRARNADELRMDVEKVFSMIPGKHRLSLHAIYAETGGRKVPRHKLEPKHFSRWMDWASDKGVGLDFNPTFFSHPNASSGFTLSSRDKGIRDFWIEHGIASRKIGEAMGKALKTTCINNFWIPDGYKDTPADRVTPRELLRDSLDAIFSEEIDDLFNRDALESKLFGIGSESYVVGSHEFYTGYAIKNRKILTLDTGHFHPTESISDKISSLLIYLDELLLHISRGVRWDSDHVVVLNDDVRSIAREIIRGNYTDRIHIALDYFDASINRVAAWVIGMRSVIKALLLALLEPYEMLLKREIEGDFTGRLALMESFKSLPFGAVWDYYCARSLVPAEDKWIADIESYESNILFNRNN